MLLIIKKKEEAEKIKGILCPKIKKKLDVNMKDSEVKRQKFGIHNQMVAPTQQEATPTHQQAGLTHRQADSPREKLPFKRKPTIVRWMPSTQESSVSDPSMTL
ncbi:hypothetical protein Goklo_012153 [Gossypium klotzschianum]|uniref:Uncharacterized protein n=1 Tax=Gossypium klotzschianum TaxID=34286 RepID=A0A7J8VCE0_9ROSI|nr:hypothetical protein [Gossypium klotzschianum]